ncbi:MAG: hypothetical protein IRZ21_01595 [Thermoleophilaceae bacterium]|nr:hypothetical protein [Thermoleophilaceae bacterium]
MRFTDFLRTSVLLFAASATALVIVAVAGARAKDDTTLLYFGLGWWTIATVGGLWLGRGAAVSHGIASLLAQARTATAIPEHEPGRILFNRMWVLAAFTLVAGALAFLIPQVPAVASGFALGAALVWRKQAAAVAAIEERDGVRFYVEPTSPFKPTRLVRTPWFRKLDGSREEERYGAPVSHASSLR